MDDTDTGLTRPITVFLLDDHEIVRRGLIDLLGTTTDIIVVGEAGTAADGAGPDPRRPARRGPARRPVAGRQRDRRVPRYPVKPA